MQVSGAQIVEGSCERVYAALNDTDVLRQCIPGCQSVERVSDDQMKVAVRLKLGPMTVTFHGEVVLSDKDPPRGYTMTGRGSGGVAGHAKGSARVSLETEGDATKVAYVVTAEIGGKIAQLGARLIDGTAKTLAASFFARLEQAMKAQVPAPAEG